MTSSWWFVAIGALLLAVAFLGGNIARWPISHALLYLAIGLGLGPAGARLIVPDLFADAPVLVLLFEIVIVVSLFTVGLKLRAPAPPGVWASTWRLAIGAMTLTVIGVGVLAHTALDFAWPEAWLLAAILAPTDPVLASDVQITHAHDADRVRAALSAEGGLNDITAAPLVTLALGMFGVHALGPYALHWVAVDVVWAVAAAVAIGWVCGRVVGRAATDASAPRNDPRGFEEFIALGVIATATGLALLVHALAFLAVLCAGLAMRRAAHAEADASVPHAVVHETLAVTARIEHLAEVAAVLTLGAMLSMHGLTRSSLLLGVALLAVIRPVAVLASLVGTALTAKQRGLVAWFGIRGVGSLYYLGFAVVCGVPRASIERIAPVVLGVVALSILVHGVSATPLMRAARARR